MSAGDEADLARIAGTSLFPASTLSEATDKFEVGFVSPADEENVLAALRADPRVENAEPMAVYKEAFVPNDPLYKDKQWHLKRVGAERAWDYACGEGVTVAVVDTGIACYDKAPFMKGSDLQGTHCTAGWNFVDNRAEAWDDQGHGTHVAGTIAQTTNNGKGVAGLAYCATLMPVKVLSKQGWGTTANVAEGIRWAADHGAQVINLSLGGPIKSKILEDAVKHATDKGALVVAAAGNSGKSVGYPAAYPEVLAVSATDSKDGIAWFSSRGPQVGIAAPGVGVTQQTICNNGRDKCEQFGTFNGTSMASPHVAGVAAMLVGQGVTDPAALRADLQSTARPKAEKNLYGAGILDAGAATTHVFYMHLALRLAALVGLALLVARRIRKKNGKVRWTAGTTFGALLTSVGLVPNPAARRWPRARGLFPRVARAARAAARRMGHPPRRRGPAQVPGARQRGACARRRAPLLREQAPPAAGRRHRDRLGGAPRAARVERRDGVLPRGHADARLRGRERFRVRVDRPRRARLEVTLSRRERETGRSEDQKARSFCENKIPSELLTFLFNFSLGR